MDYKLSAVLNGHLLDVRGLAVTNDGCIVSVSRDKTVKLWKPNCEDNGFTNIQTYSKHEHYVMCATVLNNSEVLPHGIILTGSNDKQIFGFVPNSLEPILIETGHKETVCKLNPGVLPDTFISSSWDATARLWKIIKVSDSEKVKLKTLLIAICNGHSMAVWSAIQLPTKHLVTGSADKNIYVHVIVSGKHDKSTTIIKKLTGHTDCVRDLAVLSENEFLSCANDATVKRWNLLTGECLETFHGHPSYIYSLCVFGDQLNSMVVTGGEDRCVNVWKSSNQQVILQPAQSIWAVTVLPNSDIVTGSSDGVIRIYSTDFKRQALKEELAVFEQEVENFNQAAQKEIGGVQIDSLPGLEGLLTSGKSDGQIIMINEDGKPVVYKWLSNESKWEKIGDVLSGSNSNKVMHEGKEYDFVWNVDLEDGEASLKLPFNKIEDPWIVAQQFIYTNNLPQSYLETIANFIISNAKLDFDELCATKQQYSDPYTGSARYVPTSSKRPALFPKTDYIKFFNAKVPQIFEKLEFFNTVLNQEFNDTHYKLDEIEIESLHRLLLLVDGTPEKKSIDLLMSLVCDWPNDKLFPILDIIRLALRNEQISDALCSDDIIMIKLLPYIYNTDNPINLMLSIRCVCNLMYHGKGELLVVKYYENIIQFIQEINETNLSLTHLQVAIGAFLLNLSIMIKHSEDSEAIQNVTNTINAVCPKLNDPKAKEYCFIAIGNLLSLKSPPTLSEQIQDYIKKIALSNSEPSDIVDCCKDIMEILSKRN